MVCCREDRSERGEEHYSSFLEESSHKTYDFIPVHSTYPIFESLKRGYSKQKQTTPHGLSLDKDDMQKRNNPFTYLRT
jgi:hypothetical protein